MPGIGKIIGGILGYLVGRWIGAIIGILIGHAFDKGIAREAEWQGILGTQKGRERLQEVFFKSTFTVMGHIAKANGRVSEEEISAARKIMARLGIEGERRLKAIEYFNQGKQADFDMVVATRELKEVCRGHRSLLQVFIEFQLEAAYAEGVLTPEKHTLLLKLCEQIGLSASILQRLDIMYQAAQRFRAYQQGAGASADETRYRRQARAKNTLQDSYQILGVAESVTNDEVKRAYRKLMSQHHPDKLIAKGLPDEMIKMATQKTQEIQAAYENISKARGM